jgi:UDP-N-acetylmuramate--alanine ligase
MKNIFCTGIGGVGMSALALYLSDAGYQVAGSDLTDFRIRTLLEAKGIKVYLNHLAKNVDGVDLLIYSTAIPQDNPEITQAKRDNIPCINRIEALQKFLGNQKIIAITGSYGKSTTTTFTASLMQYTGLHPSWLIGADLFSFPPAGYHLSDWTVLETDESKPVFLNFSPYAVIMTNIGIDHLPSYNNSQELLAGELLKFITKKNHTTKVLLNGDDINSFPLIQKLKKSNDVILCGLGDENDYQIKDIQTNQNQGTFQTTFSLTCPDGKVFYCHIPMPGEKNVIDAILALGMTIQLGANRERGIEGLSKLPCMDRRFEICRFSESSILIDDEGDSPEVIQNVLQNAKKWFPQKKLLVVLQPHRYSRLNSLFEDYVKTMSFLPDEIILLPVFSAGEKELPEINSEKLRDAIIFSNFPSDKIRCFTIQETLEYLVTKMMKNNLIITLGPGDVWKVAKYLAKT